MRRLFGWCALALVAVSTAGAYAAAPFWTAYTLSEAVRTANTPVIKRSIEWAPFRASLRRSIMRSARLAPAVTSAARRIRPTLWQRVKHAFGSSMVDRFIETNITPTGLPKLYANARRKHERRQRHIKSRSTFAQRMVERARAPVADAPFTQVTYAKPSAPAVTPLDQDWRTRVRTFMARLERAAFLDWSTAELQIRDRDRADRAYRARFELIGLRWKLTTVDIIERSQAVPRVRPTRTPRRLQTAAQLRLGG